MWIVPVTSIKVQSIRETENPDYINVWGNPVRRYWEHPSSQFIQIDVPFGTSVQINQWNRRFKIFEMDGPCPYGHKKKPGIRWGLIGSDK